MLSISLTSNSNCISMNNKLNSNPVATSVVTVQYKFPAVQTYTVLCSTQHRMLYFWFGSQAAVSRGTNLEVKGGGGVIVIL